MLTGDLPLGRFDPPSKKVHIDVRLDEVVLRTLENKPNLRYQQASELKTELESITGIFEKLPPNIQQAFGYEYRSKTEIFGLPLVHIALGVDLRTGKKRVAKGILAIGDIAKGIFAFGWLAMGVVAFGGLTLGVFSVGGAPLGVVALGGCAVGLVLAYGGLALAPIALGGLAIDYYAAGGAVWGQHIISGRNQSPEAMRFFRSVRDWRYLTFGMMAILAVGSLISFFVPWAMKRHHQKRKRVA